MQTKNKDNNTDDYLQLKICDFLEKAKQMNQSLLHNLHSQKQFHNPQIMQKMVHKQLNDEYGTNYPSTIYTPISVQQVEQMKLHSQRQSASSTPVVVDEEDMIKAYREQQKAKYNRRR